MKKHFTTIFLTCPILFSLFLLAGCSKNVESTLIEAPVSANQANRGPSEPADPTITYVAKTQKGDKIMVMNSSGANQAAVATATGIFSPPSWSPDGQSISFNGIIDGVREFWIVDVSINNGVPVGTNLRKIPLPFSSRPMSSARWSPSGNQLLFSNYYDRTIYSVAPDGTGLTALYTSPEGLSPLQADWSPDGLKIVFTERHPGTSGPYSAIVVLDLAMQVKTVVVSESGDAFYRGAAWSSNGDRIAFSDNLFKETIWTVTPTENATPVRITEGVFPRWSPDDSKIVIEGVYRYDMATGSKTKLTTGSWPDWKRNSNP